MSQDFNDRVENARKILESRDSAFEKSKIPIKKDDKTKKETPKNDEFNEYDFSDDKELDDIEW